MTKTRAKATSQRNSVQGSGPKKRKGGQAATLQIDTLPSLLGFHLRLANIAMVRDFMVTVSGLDLTQRQSAILMLIGANPGTRQIALAEFLSTDRATMVGMIDKLEARGLITRSALQHDRRVRSLHLTPAGLRTLRLLKQHIVEHEGHFKRLFSEKELPQFMRFLARVHRKL